MGKIACIKNSQLFFFADDMTIFANVETKDEAVVLHTDLGARLTVKLTTPTLTLRNVAALPSVARVTRYYFITLLKVRFCCTRYVDMR